MQPRNVDRAFERCTGIVVALFCGGLVAVTALDAWQAYQVDSALYEMEQAHKRLYNYVDEALRRLQEQQNEGEPFSTDEAEREMGI